MRILLATTLVLVPRLALATHDCMGCGCLGVTPAVPAPEALWGELRPTDVGTLPADRDTSEHDEFQGEYWRYPYWMSLDVENGWLFAATNVGFQVWDVATDPAQPRQVAFENGRYGDFPWFNVDPHMTFPVADVDAPEGVDDLVALAVDFGGGLVVWDTTAKSAPLGIYQHHGEGARAVAVHAMEIGGRAWAFVADTARGLVVYDMTAARALGRCVEDDDVDGEECPGVLVGAASARTSGVAVDGAGTLVAYAATGAGSATEIWDVSDPRAPVRLAEIPPSAGILVSATALWQEGDRVFVATRTDSEAAIYDVSCALEGPCEAGEPVWRASIPGLVSRLTVTFSRSGETPFLHFGSIDRCSGGLQREWLFDVRDPASPRDVTPPPAEVDGVETGYWGWYYLGNHTGPNRGVAPLVGKFAGPYFYRAASVILDVHEWIAPVEGADADTDVDTDADSDEADASDEATTALADPTRAAGCSCEVVGGGRRTDLAAMLLVAVALGGFWDRRRSR